MGKRIILLIGSAILLLLIYFIAGCTNITGESTDEEICLAIETDYLRDRCLAYVKEDPDICQSAGCYALARKLRDGNLCTMQSEDKTNYWGKNENGPGNIIKKVSNEGCKEFAEMSDEEMEELRQNTVGNLANPKIPKSKQDIRNRGEIEYFSKEEILSKTPMETCALDEKECYGTCKVAKGTCIKAVARIKRDPKICKLTGDWVPSHWESHCYHELAIVTGDIEICNKAKKVWKDECYFDIITDNIYYIYDSLKDTRDKSIAE
jgi:hypothetical protein